MNGGSAPGKEGPGMDEAVKDLISRLEKAGADVFYGNSPSQLTAAFSTIWETGVKPVAEGTGRAGGWIPDPAFWHPIIEATWPVPVEKAPHDRDAITVGVTGVAWAAADTGTLVLYGTDATPLWPSLLPPVHVVLVRQSQVVSSLKDGLDRLFQENYGTTKPPLVKLVSGPSMTADIEGELILGVHGPKRLTVVIDGTAQAP